MRQHITLTPDHIARFDEYRAKWIGIGLSTEPADFDRAERAVRSIYTATGNDQPLVVLRMGSPYGAIMGGYLAHHMLDTLGLEEQQVGQQVWQQVWQQVRYQVWQQVRQQVEQQVEQHVGQQVRQQVEQQVGQQVRQQVEQQVGQQVRQQVEQQVRLHNVQKKFGLSVYDYRGANLWASWHSYVSFFIENGFLDGTSKAVENYLLDRAIAESCGLVWYSSAVAAISDRPERIVRNASGQLHCENGPAIRYRDGWALHAWNGVVVPAHWIESRDDVDPLEVLKVDNVEQRAAGLAILGARMIPTLIEQKRARWIDDSGSPDIGRLIEVKLPDLPDPGRYLVAACPRNGEIMEGVPLVSEIDGLPIDTAIAAQAWRIGDPQSEYAHPPRRT